MKSYFLMMRPTHWSKNIFVFAVFLFRGRFVGPTGEVFLAVLSALAAFICFSLASSAIYIFSDIIDRNKNTNKSNMLSFGQVSLAGAVAFAIFCATVALLGAFFLVEQLAIVVGAYLVLMICFTLFLRKVFIVDVIVMSVGFVLCAMGGAIVIGSFISKWLIICTFSLCLFLGFGKRRGQLAVMSETERLDNEELKGYTLELLGHLLNVTAALAIICFLLYSLDERTVSFFGTSSLIYTTPFVLYGIFRFSALIQKGVYSDPVTLAFEDRPFQAAVLLWLLCSLVIVYAGKTGFDTGGILAY